MTNTNAWPNRALKFHVRFNFTDSLVEDEEVIRAHLQKFQSRRATAREYYVLSFLYHSKALLYAWINIISEILLVTSYKLLVPANNLVRGT